MKKITMIVAIWIILLLSACSEETAIQDEPKNEVNDDLVTSDDWVYYCKSNSDCEIKNIGSCCGYYPSCVNKNFSPDLDAVRKECKEMWFVSVCWHEVIDRCRCVNNTCESYQWGRNLPFIK